MKKVEKGAEPKNKRIVHIYNEVYEFYHISLNRNEYSINRSKGIHRTSAFGYFFIGHESDIKKVTTKQDIIDNWEYCKLNDYGYTSLGFGKSCYAIYDRKKNVLIIDSTRYEEVWHLTKSINKDCKIVMVNNINDWNIINKPKQLGVANLIYLIKQYQHNFNEVYRIINNKTICAHTSHLYHKEVLKLRDKIIELADKFKTIPRNKPLGKTIFEFNTTSWDKCNWMEIDMLTINQIINYTEFTKEERKLYRQRVWWTRYGYNHGISFKDTLANWNIKIDGVVWQKHIVNKQNESLKAFNDKVNKLREGIEAKRHKLITDILNISVTEQLKRWREESNENGYDKLPIIYDDIKIKGRKVEWFKHEEFVSLNCFENKQLKLSKDKKEVITSACAKVTLVHALMLFNRLYLKYIVPKLVDWVNADEDYKVDFTNKHITIGYYNLRNIGYCTKVTDYHHISKGYKEWYVEIGCHTLWFDDVKEFCRYYHLEDKVKFNCSEIKH